MKKFLFIWLLIFVVISCQRQEMEPFDLNQEAIIHAKDVFYKEEFKNFKITPNWDTFESKNDLSLVSVLVNNKIQAKWVLTEKDGVYYQNLLYFNNKAKKFYVFNKEGYLSELVSLENNQLKLFVVEKSPSLSAYKICSKDRYCEAGKKCKDEHCNCDCHKKGIDSDTQEVSYHISNIDSETGDFVTIGGITYVPGVAVYGNMPHKNSLPNSDNNNLYNNWFLNDLFGRMHNFGTNSYINPAGVTIQSPEMIIDKITNPKIKCIHDKLRNGKNDYVKQILDKFEGESSDFDVEISSVPNLTRNNDGHSNGRTTYEGTRTIKIKISENYAQTASALEIAKTIFHEYIHAELFRIIEIKENFNKESLDFQKAYEIYFEQNKKEHQHELMAHFYIGLMRDALKQFHKTELINDYNKYINHYEKEPTDEFYEAIAWKGLKVHNVKAWQSLDEDKQARINTLLQEEVGMLSKKCE